MVRKVMLLIACLLPGVAHAGWQQGSSRHFVLYSNDTPENVRAFTTKLERFDKGMRAMRGLPDDPISPSSRVTVYVVERVSDVQRLAGRQASNVAGFYQARVEPVAFVPLKAGDSDTDDLSALQILLHEYSHHFMFSNWNDAAFPAWLTEGFAEFNATAKFGEDGSLTLGEPPLYRAYGVFNSDLPAQLLLEPDHKILNGDQEQALYGRGWLLTHYLSFEPSRKGELGAYIAAINAGKPPREAMQALHDVKKLDGALNAYIRKKFLPVVTLKGAGLAIEPVTVRALSPAEAAMMPALIRSKNGVDAKTAPGVADLARRLAAPFPNDPAAQNVLVEAEHDAGHYEAAMAAADRVLAVDPKSVHALLYKGMILMRMAEKAGNADAKTWQAARAWLLKANKLDLEDPLPLIQYYYSFEAAKQKPTKNADAALLYAHALAPYDLGLRVAAGRIYLEQGDADGARKALTPVAYSPHGEGLAAFARNVLAVLAEKGAPAALAVMTGDKDTDGGKDAGKGAGKDGGEGAGKVTPK